jgi:hypothetical protein
MIAEAEKGIIRTRIQYILNRIKSEIDLDTLGDYRTVFCQEVSFFKRNLVAAYLLMAERTDTGASKPRRGGEPRKKAFGETEGTRLFFNVGRNRRIFPREIMGFIINESPAAKSDIGEIRIMDYYSFIQVKNEVAEAVIHGLSGKLFRGKPLVVDYARIRREGGETGHEADVP